MKEQLESVERQTGIRPAELDEMVEMPDTFIDVWHVFLELHSARGSNGFGVDPISFTEIDAYCRLYMHDLEVWELKMLRRFDNAVLQMQAKDAEAKQKANKSKSK